MGEAKSQTTKELTPVIDADTAKAAADGGLSVMALRAIFAATGAPCPIDYGPTVGSLAQVGIHFGVSERTVANWKARGMPGEPGHYNLPRIQQWRRQQNDPEPWHFTGNPKLTPRQASGDLVRGLLRSLRVHLKESAHHALSDFLTALDGDGFDEVRELVEFAFQTTMIRHFEQYSLTDEEIERFLEECWEFV